MDPTNAPPVQIRLLTLQFQHALGAFDSRPLDQFLADKELVELRDHFFVAQELPFLLCVVRYRLPERDARGRESTRRRAPRPADLDDRARELFETLRTWRSERAQRDGVPLYVVFTNRELAAIAATRPATANAMLEITGVGAGKVERYATDVLAAIGSAE